MLQLTWCYTYDKYLYTYKLHTFFVIRDQWNIGCNAGIKVFIKWANNSKCDKENWYVSIIVVFICRLLHMPGSILYRQRHGYRVENKGYSVSYVVLWPVVYSTVLRYQMIRLNLIIPNNLLWYATVKVIHSDQRHSHRRNTKGSWKNKLLVATQNICIGHLWAWISYCENLISYRQRFEQ